MSEKSNIWYFEESNLYELLCPNKAPNMEKNHDPNVFKKDEFIFFPNDEASNIYMVANGRVKIGSYNSEGKEIVKSVLAKGEIFGEMILTGEKKRNDFAQAMDNNTRVCPMTVEDLQALMKDNESLSFKIYKIIGLRFKKLERRIESLVFKDARTRIVEFFKDMAEERGQKVGFETMIKNHLTHKDIASLTGTSRQTVTTVMNELREENIINFDRRRILIRDMDRLV